MLDALARQAPRAALTAIYPSADIPVDATMHAEIFSASLISHDGSYLLPLRTSVKDEAGVTMSDQLDVQLRIGEAA